MKRHQRNLNRRKKVQELLYEISFYLELVAALIVIILIIAQTAGLVMNMVSNSSMLTHSDEFTSFLGKCLNIVIGIEFLKMLCRHNMDAVIEVLLFTLARHLIVKQFEILEGLICVVAISLLFVVRRFLFVAHIDNVYDEFKKDKEEAPKSPDGEKLEEYV